MKQSNQKGRSNSSEMVTFFLTGQTSLYEKNPIPEKNYHKQNLKNIKLVQNKKRLEQEQITEQEKINQKRFILPKFANVNSKVKENILDNLNLPKTEELPAPTINFVQRNKEPFKKSQDDSNINKKSNYGMNRKPPIPRMEEIAPIEKPTLSKNYISENRLQAINAMPPPAKIDEKRYIDKENYGKVPDYIIERRLQVIDNDRKKSEEDEKRKIPPGMRKMEESERLETLELLKKNKTQVEDEISRLPLTIETPSMIKHEKQLRKKLQESENAIEIFSKKVVFVAK